MPSKMVYYIGAFIGSTVGAFIPMLWGASLLSFSSILFSGIGGILGIVAIYKLSS